jgi:hypothetical protein
VYRLHSGTPRVQARIVELLMPTYFPHASSASTQLIRALALIRKNPDAAKAFFAVVHQHVPQGAVSKLVLVLYKCLVRIAKKKTGIESDDDNEEESSEAEVEGSGSSDDEKKSSDDEEGDDEEEEEKGKRGTKRKGGAIVASKVKSKANGKGAKKKHKGGDDDDEENEASDDDESESKSAQKKGGAAKKAAAASAKKKLSSEEKRAKRARVDSSLLDLEASVTETMLLIMAQLWHSIDQSSEEFNQQLVGVFSDGTLQLLLQAYPSDVCRIAIITM